MTLSDRAPLGAALAVLLTLITLTGPLSPVLMTGLLCLLTLMVAAGWPSLLELSSPRGTSAVVLVMGVLASLAALFSPGDGDPLWYLVVICAVGVFASFVHQMLRPRRDGLSASLTGTVAGTMLTALGSTWLLAQASAEAEGKAGLLTLCAASLAVALLLTTLSIKRAFRLVAGAVVAAGIATALTSVLTTWDWWQGTLLGAVVAVGGGGVHILLDSGLASEEPLPALATAAAPVLTVGVVALLVLVLPI
jgi:hypothetical protein